MNDLAIFRCDVSIYGENQDQQAEISQFACFIDRIKYSFILIFRCTCININGSKIPNVFIVFEKKTAWDDVKLDKKSKNQQRMTKSSKKKETWDKHKQISLKMTKIEINSYYWIDETHSEKSKVINNIWELRVSPIYPNYTYFATTTTMLNDEKKILHLYLGKIHWQPNDTKAFKWDREKLTTIPPPNAPKRFLGTSANHRLLYLIQRVQKIKKKCFCWSKWNNKRKKSCRN